MRNPKMLVAVAAALLTFPQLAIAPTPSLAGEHRGAGRPWVDLTLTMTDSPDPVRSTDRLTYWITVTNVAKSTATDVTVTDVFDPETYISHAGASQGTCTWDWTQADKAVNCELGSLAEAASASVLITLERPQTENTASVTSAEPDKTPDDNVDTETTTVEPFEFAELDVDITDSPDPYLAPDLLGTGAPTITYTITITNVGSGTESWSYPDEERAFIRFEHMELKNLTTTAGSCTHHTWEDVKALDLLKIDIDCGLGKIQPGESVVLVLEVAPCAIAVADGRYLSISVTNDSENSMWWDYQYGFSADEYTEVRGATENCFD